MYQLNGERAELSALPHMVYFDCELLMSAGGERKRHARWGYQMQGEHDGLEEDRSDPEGRGAHGPARPT